MKRIVLVIPAALFSLAGCDGLKSAMTAHADVVATAGSQELTTERLADLIGNSTVPLSPNMAENEPIARAITDVWVNYQLMAQAAAAGDSLNDPSEMDPALWQQINQLKVAKLFQEVQKTWMSTDSTYTEADYLQGDLLSAAHILFMFPTPATPQQRDSVKAEADRVLRTVTAANFGDMARRHSKDPGSSENNGLYAAFPKGQMVPEFENAVLALKPGEISGLVQSNFGYHIIRRPMLDEVRAQHVAAKGQVGASTAETEYLENVVETGKIEVKGKAGETMKAVAKDLDGHANSKTVMATSIAGRYTAADFARLVRSAPNRAEIIQQIEAIPDTMVESVLKDIIRSDLLVRLADSAKIGPDSTELQGMRGQLTAVLVNAWRQLGVEPETLGDSAQNKAERSRLAASRVEAYIDGMMMQTRDFLPVPDPLEVLLRDEFGYKINKAGITRALEQAVKVRATADSARMNVPPSAIPMPGDTGPATIPPTGRGG